MKIAIISDSHDNVPNLEKALGWINSQGISLIIHCGDLCAPSMLSKVIVPNFEGKIHLVHGNVGDPKLLEEVAKSFPNVTVHGQVGELEIEYPSPFGDNASHFEKMHRRRVRGKIAFTHYPEQGKKLAETQKYALVFYGHTHKPWIQKYGLTQTKTEAATDKSPRKSVLSPRKSVLLVNPGTLAGMFYKATFAIYDTETDPSPSGDKNAIAFLKKNASPLGEGLELKILELL